MIKAIIFLFVGKMDVNDTRRRMKNERTSIYDA